MPMFTDLLGSEWLPAVPTFRTLLAEPPARSPMSRASGWSSIAIARAYPLVHVDGIDLDTASIARHGSVAGTDVESRVVFHERDAADPALAGEVQPCDDIPGAPRHVVSVRGAQRRYSMLGERAR